MWGVARLARAPDDGRVRAAALDVFCVEPLPQASSLWAHARVMVSAHIAAGVGTTAAGAAAAFLDNFVGLFMLVDRTD